MSISTSYANDVLKPAPVPAQIISDHPISGQLSAVLAALPDGRLYSLDKDGTLVQLDRNTAGLHSFTNLPAFSALTANDKGLWAVSSGKAPELYHLTPDGVVVSRLSLDNMATPTSHIPALQVGHDYAYISDEGAPAFIIVDLKTNSARRIMINYPSLIAERPYKRDGKIERNKDGHILSLGNVRYLALSQDGKKLFYQTPPGPFYMIETFLLNDPSTGPAELLEAMVKWRNSYCLGGLAITPENTLYMADVEHGDLIGVPQKHLPELMTHDKVLTQARDMVFIPKGPSSKAQLALLVGSSDEVKSSDNTKQAFHLLIINLP